MAQIRLALLPESEIILVSISYAKTPIEKE
jgi:hypothetical protein